MKTCACCSLQNSATDPTCVACGEASWLDAPVVESVPEVVDAEADAGDSVSKFRKGRR